MRGFRAIMTIILLLCITAVLHADPLVDPRMILAGGGSSPEIPPGEFTFPFASNSFGGGFLDFVNNSGKDWISLTIVTDQNPADVEHWDLDATKFFHYKSLEVTDHVTIKFWGTGPGYPGILDVPDGIPLNQYPPADFTINLNASGTDPNGGGGWLTDNGSIIKFTAVAVGTEVHVPEPGTLSLVLVGALGVGGLFFRRRP